MGKIAAELSDLAIVTSDNPRTEDPYKILRQILAGMQDTETPYEVIESRVSAIGRAMELAQKDDVIVLCGKGPRDVSGNRPRKSTIWTSVRSSRRIWRANA